MKLVTHDGKFHADDVCATAALLFLFPHAKIIRTRDEQIIHSADIVFDVGRIYNIETLRFDHHQQGGAGVRENNVPYAAFGLIWKQYGEKVCEVICEKQSIEVYQEIAQKIEQKIVCPVDAHDNGVIISKPLENFSEIYEYSFSDIIEGGYNPLYTEASSFADTYFFDAVAMVQIILKKEIKKALAKINARTVVLDVYEKTQDKRLIILDAYVPWHEVLSKKTEPLFVIHPHTNAGKWVLQTISNDTHSFVNRKDLPQAWAGKSDAELQKITGVSDALFCHNARFMAIANSKEGIVLLAQKALE